MWWTPCVLSRFISLISFERKVWNQEPLSLYLIYISVCHLILSSGRFGVIFPCGLTPMVMDTYPLGYWSWSFLSIWFISHVIYSFLLAILGDIFILTKSQIWHYFFFYSDGSISSMILILSFYLIHISICHLFYPPDDFRRYFHTD